MHNWRHDGTTTVPYRSRFETGETWTLIVDNMKPVESNRLINHVGLHRREPNSVAKSVPLHVGSSSSSISTKLNPKLGTQISPPDVDRSDQFGCLFLAKKQSCLPVTSPCLLPLSPPPLENTRLNYSCDLMM